MDALERALREVDPCACLVEPRVVRRVLQRHRRVRLAGLQVPHARCYWIDRQSFTAFTSARERASMSEVPEQVILLARPDGDGGLREVWRALFHARVHVALEARRPKLELAEVRARVHRIGQTTFDEIRAVLRQDELLLPGADDVETWIEFAATYLELSRFENDAVDEIFPTLDRAVAEETLALDLDADALLARCRPPGVEEPVVPRAPSSAPPPPSLPVSRGAGLSSARARGNVVAAAFAAENEEALRAELTALVRRLREAAGEGSDDDLLDALVPVVHLARTAALPSLSTEGRFLWDLLRACIEHEREPRTVDLLGAVGSLFRRKVVRALPAARVVRVVLHLRRALEKIPKTRLPRDRRAKLRDVVEAIAGHAERRMRQELRPKIFAVLAEVGLEPRNVPEAVAREKLGDELLDRIVSRGFLDIGDLRDALSRNRLKCDDLRPLQLFTGDELLRADRRLAEELDGVYRRGEIYLRWLQKASSLGFGTATGRLLVWWLLLPLLAAFVVLEGLQHVVGPVAKRVAHVQVHLLNRWSLLGLALFVLALVQSERVRAAAKGAAKAFGRALHALFVAAPVWLFTRPLVIALATSAPSRLFARFVLKPLVLAAPAYLVARWLRVGRDVALVAGGACLLLASALLNSPLFAIVEEKIVDATARAVRNVRKRILPGLLTALLDAFRFCVEGLERTIYWVDERLVFRDGDSTLSLVAKGAFGVVWGVITFLVRIYVNLLIEPQVNPIKHFPVVTVSHKIILPMLPAILEAMRAPLLPLGAFVANTIAGTTVFLLPGVFGFLVWELKENYRLYRASLPRRLAPVTIGTHGETMTGLLVPGFHSGTVPKLWVELRRNARRIARREPFWRLAVRAHTRSITEVHHVEEAVARFVERELVALLERSPRWTLGAPRVAAVRMGSNRVVVELAPHGEGRPCSIAFEEQSGWILAHVADPGFLRDVDPASRAVFADALAGLYQLAAVDFVREEIEAELDGAAYDVCDEGLAVWPDRAFETELVYSLDATGEVRPIVRGAPVENAKPLDVGRLRFRAAGIEWSAWTRAWSSEDRAPIVSRRVLPAP